MQYFDYKRFAMLFVAPILRQKAPNWHLDSSSYNIIYVQYYFIYYTNL